MKILIDTREWKKPLPFKVGGVITEVKTITLPVGDYMCTYEDGSSPPVTWDRKTISDLYGTMLGGYPRWKRLMAKAKKRSLDLGLIIEGTLSDVLDGCPYSKWSGDSLVQKLFTLGCRYKLPVVFCKSRFEMVRYITEHFSAIGREYVAQRKASAIHPDA